MMNRSLRELAGRGPPSACRYYMGKPIGAEGTIAKPQLRWRRSGPCRTGGRGVIIAFGRKVTWGDHRADKARLAPNASFRGSAGAGRGVSGVGRVSGGFWPPLARGVRRATCWSYDFVEGLSCRGSSTSFQAFSDKGAIHEQSPEP